MPLQFKEVALTQGLKKESREIHGASFEVQAIPAMAGGAVLARLLAILGGVFAGKGDLGKLSPADFESIATELLLEPAVCTMNGQLLKRSTLNLGLPKGAATLMKLVMFAIEVNFGDFFVDAASLAALLKEGPAKDSE